MKRISVSRGGDDDERESRLPDEVDEIERILGTRPKSPFLTDEVEEAEPPARE